MSFKTICFFILAIILIISGIVTVYNKNARNIRNQGTFVYIEFKEAA